MSKSTGTNAPNISRRSFVGATAAAMAALTMAGCQPENKIKEAPEEIIADKELDPNTSGKWVTAGCAINCGGMCHNQVYMVDGVVVRQKTDDSEDSLDNPQLRACPRGRSRRQWTFSADRLKYPMKRKSWQPGGGENSNGNLRGVDEWERISWDEAFKLAAEEMKRILDTYGNTSVLVPAGFYSNGTFFNALGGAYLGTDCASFGTSTFGAHAMGLSAQGLGEDNDRFDFVNADTIVLYGCNPAWASPGSYTYFFKQAKDSGTKFVYVGPDYNASAAMFDAKWITVRPGTDCAFLLAVAHEMLKADETDPGSVIDWEFLSKYTVGFDLDHMPADADTDECFVDYVMGKHDGIEKTPEWATEICGTPVEDIVWYAQLMSKENAVTTLRSFAASRHIDSDNFLPLYMTIGCMGGHMGKPGHCTGTAYHACVGSGNPYIITAGSNGLPYLPPTISDYPCAPKWWDFVLTGKFTSTSCAMNGWEQMPAKTVEADIKMIFNHEVSSLQSTMGVMKGIEAFRKVDFVLCTASFLTTSAKYSDIVLPTATQWEEFGTVKGGGYGLGNLFNRDALIVSLQITEPLFEAKTNQDILTGLFEALGVDPTIMFPISEKQQFFNILNGTTVRNEANTADEPLITITQEDLDKWEIEGTVQEGRITLDELLEKGIYKVPRNADDKYRYYGYQDYLKDPEANPRPTPSGKFEIYCKTKSDTLNAMGYTKNFEWKPLPTYVRRMQGYEDTFADWDKKEKGKYPFQMFNLHYLRRSHTQFDNVGWLREAFTNPLFVNTSDAEAKGVKNGDVVLVTSEYGKTLRHASVSDLIMPGCLGLPHGAWAEVDDQTGIDKAGSDNVMTGQVTSGSGISGYNSALVDFELWTGEDLEDDHLWPQRIIDFE